MAALAFLLLALLGTPAWAALSRAQLDQVLSSPPPGARLDPSFTAPDSSGRVSTLGETLSGRPGFLAFVDYTCNTLCGTELELLAQALQAGHLAPADFRIVIVGLDPKDSPEAALALEREEIPAPLWPATTLLLPDETAVKRATAALGFHYAYDPAIDQFAHPATVYVLGPDGTLRHALSPFALATGDLHSLLGASGRGAGFFETVRHLCYAYDPATGVYNLRVITLLRIGALLTLLILSTGLIVLARIRSRAA
jgi:protein SCO1/2